MTYYLIKLLFFSSGLVLAASAGVARFRLIDKTYQPFIIYLCVGVLNEVASYYSGKNYGTNIINCNIFMLAELIILNWQFKGWNKEHSQLRWYLAAAVFFGCLFVAEVIRQGIDQPLPYFNLLYCFYLVLCATRQLAEIAVDPPQPLFKNARFIICMGIIFYFSYRIILEAFWLYGLEQSKSFRMDVHHIQLWVNLMVDFMYVYAILWMQKKPGYITFYG